jgi:hypothetical protein
MTSDIAAPAAGAVAAAGGLLLDGGVVAEVVVVCPEWLLLAVEHAATSNGTASRTAIRIPSG